jgi:hypothetical protein
VLEVVIDGGDDQRDEHELDERPHGKGEKPDNAEEEPQDDTNRQQDSDCLGKYHATPSLLSIVGAVSTGSTASILYW